MNWDALGSIGEIVGAIAVVSTLAYLSVQIRQGTKAARIQTAHDTFHLSFEFLALINKEENAEVWSRFRIDGIESFTPKEQLQISTIARAMFTTYDSHYISYLEGTLSLEIHNSYRARLLGQLTVPSIRKWWMDNNELFTTSFRTYISDLLSEELTKVGNV